MSVTELKVGGLDTHCHVDLFPSPGDVVAQAEARGIYTIAVTNAPSVFFHTQSLVKGRKSIRAALGLHPELVRTHGRELERMLELLPETRFVGEVGLDFSATDEDDKRNQIRVFEAILQRSAASGNKVLTVHSRRASSAVVSAVGRSFPGVVILHWFSGPLRDLEAAIDAGMYFSVNPAMVRSANGRKLIAAMPRNRVLTETDGPFVETGGHPAAPPDVREVFPALASLWKCSAAEAQSTVFQNFLGAVGDF